MISISNQFKKHLTGCFTSLYWDFAIQCVFPTPSTSGLALFLMPSRGGTCDLWLPSGWCHSRLPAPHSAGLRPTCPAAAAVHQPPVGLARLSPLKLFLLPGTPSAVCAQVSLSAVPSGGPAWLRCYPASRQRTRGLKRCIWLLSVSLLHYHLSTWGQVFPTLPASSPYSDGIPFHLRKVL